MSWEDIIKNKYIDNSAKDPRKHQFDVLVTVQVDSIDEDLVDYHTEHGSGLIRNIYEEIIDDIKRKIGNDISALTVDIDDIEDSLALDNRVDVRVSKVSIKYPNYQAYTP